MKIDLEPIRKELGELCGTTKFSVKLSRKQDIGLRIRVSESAISVVINPSKVRSVKKLESFMKIIRKALE